MAAKNKRKAPPASLAASPEQVQAVQGRRRSNAATSHDSRPKRQRTRAAVKRAAQEDSSG